MFSWYRYLVGGIILFSLYNCSKQAERSFTFDPGSVLAIVNTDTIYSEAYEETYINALSRTGYADTEQGRYFHLNQLIDEYLLAQEALRLGLNDSLTAHYVMQTKNRTLRNLFVKYEFLEQLDLPDEKRTRFAFYRSKQKPYVRQLFFSQESQAIEYHNRLINGASFLDLANELYVTASYDSLAGFIGEINYFGVDDVFAETAFSLDAGEFSRPVRTRQGYVIIYVDNWKLNPIITETEFEQRSDAIRFMLHQRDYQMGADSFIRAYMSALNPSPVLENIETLQGFLYQRLPQRTQPLEMQRPVPTDLLVETGTLDVQAPLITFTHHGTPKAFRVQDYLNWIDSLPFDEIRNRFDASLGRALMWDTFAKESISKGYDLDPFVDFNAAVAKRLFLSNRLRSKLSEKPVLEIEETDISEAYFQFGYHKRQLSNVTYKLVAFDSFEDARRVQSELLTNDKEFESLPGVQLLKSDKENLRTNELYSHLSRIPLGSTHLIGTASGWYIIKIVSRDFSEDSLDDVSSLIRDQLKPIYNEFKLLRELRSKSVIHVDTVAFNKLMNTSPKLDMK
jgi:hypothetical protein